MTAQGPPYEPPGGGGQEPYPQQYPPAQGGGYGQQYPPPQGYPPQPGYPGGPPQGYPPQQYDQAPLAGVGARIGAALIDLVILMVIFFLFAAATGGFDTTNGFEVSLTGAPALFNFLLNVAYFTVLEATTGATVGKLAVGIRVVKEDYRLADFAAVLIRNLVRIVDYFFCFLVGLIMIAATKKRQRLGDMAANTLVVRKEYVRS